MAKPALLLTRPEAQSRAFAELVQDQAGSGVDIKISPLMRIDPTMPEWMPEARVVIFTSVNAVAEYTALSPAKGRLAYCVGDRTAEAARAVGFDARSAGGDARALVRLVRKDAPEGPILHPTGRHTRGDVASALRQSGLNAREVVVYDQLAQPLSDPAMELLISGRPVLVPLFSPRSAAIFTAQVTGSDRMHIICMSEAVKAAMTGEFPVVSVIEEPTGGHMLKAVLGGLLGGLSP